MFCVHTTQEELKNKDLALKTHQIFSVHTAKEEFKNTAITSDIALVFEEN